MNHQKNITEHNEVIANRVPPGDRWILIHDKQKIVYTSITDVLEAYHNVSNFKGDYRLSPLDGKLYAIKIVETNVIPEQPKRFDIYGDPT